MGPGLMKKYKTRKKMIRGNFRGNGIIRTLQIRNGIVSNTTKTLLI